MRKIRKKIYVLQEKKNPTTEYLLKKIVKSYQLVDKTIMKRASKIDRKSEKVYSTQKKFLCVMVPKCGSRTILLGLQRASEKDGFDLNIKEKDIKEFTTGYEGVYRFAIVRDPWSRTYSCYKQKIENSSPIKQALHFTGRPGLRPDMSFEDFVYWLCSEPGADRFADRHWASQNLILGIDLGITYNFIGKIENMDIDMQKISESIGLPDNSFNERRNTTLSNKSEYLSHYTQEMVDLIAKRYEDDIREFGYTAPELHSRI